jgi:hypothetical protein
MNVNAETIAIAIKGLQDEVLALKGLGEDYGNSRTEFFPGVVASDPGSRAVARHLEWFLLERVSPPLGGVPVEELGYDEDLDLAHTLRRSLVGVFEITSLAEDGTWLRDLAGFGEYPVADMSATEVLAVGDVIFGRLFPLGDGSYHLSPTAGHYRDDDLRMALRFDLERARERGGSKVLRLGQADLETLFWASGPQEVGADPLEEARNHLRAGGLGEEDVRNILDRLGAQPFDAATLVAGVGDVVGDILDELAFDADLDLGEMRRLLLAAWRHLRACGKDTGRRARDRELTGKDADGAGNDRSVPWVEPGTVLDAEAALESMTPAPDFPGVVGALVEEFIWETSHDMGDEAAERYGILRMLGRFGSDIGVAENLTARDLLRFCALWIPEHDEVRNGDEGRQLLSALGRFCRWCEEEQGLPLRSGFAESLRGLGQSLPRIAEANRRRTRHEAQGRGEVFEVLASDGGRLLLREAGRQELDTEVGPELGEWIAAGDYLRGTILEDGRVAVYCSYPPQVAPLLA